MNAKIIYFLQFFFSFIFYRSGIEKNTGTHWLRVEQPKDAKTVFKQIEVEGETLMATDKDNNVFYKFGFNKELKGKKLRYKIRYHLQPSYTGQRLMRRQSSLLSPLTDISNERS